MTTAPSFVVTVSRCLFLHELVCRLSKCKSGASSHSAIYWMNGFCHLLTFTVHDLTLSDPWGEENTHLFFHTH